ncbi:Uncharacterised protein [uncultured archaeon]|nr:Uncharacterised protein [uncultured archaeon]
MKKDFKMSCLSSRGRVALSGLVALLLVGLFAASFLVNNAIGQTTGPQNYSVVIGNAAPTLGTVACCWGASGNPNTCADSYTPAASTDYVIRCNVTATDTNGYADIVGANMSVYTDAAAEGCTADQDVCYKNTSCSLLSGSGTTVTVSCGYTNIKYFADASSTWNSKIYVWDNAPASANAIDSALTIADLVAMTQSATLGFGSMNVGDTGSANFPGKVNESATTTNTGNVNVNISVTAPAQMVCSTTGNIGVGNITGNTTAGGTFPSSCKLVASTTIGKTDCPMFGIDLADQEDTTVTVTAKTYWGISIPAGVRGTCWADTVFNAIKA